MNQSFVRRLKEKPLIRIIAYPMEQIRRIIRLARFKDSEDAQFIRSLKGIHKGEACFVIGNGPSLAPNDLDMIAKAGIPSFATNRVHKIYPRTCWRPTYYLALDIFEIEDDIDNIKASGDYPKFINYSAKHLGRTPQDNIHYICAHESFHINTYQLNATALSDDPSNSLTRTFTVTVNAIELATYMGFKTIYLLGVDNDYVHKRQPNGKIIVDPNVKSSYFQGAEPSETLGVSIQPVELMNKSYELAKEFAKKHGVNIYNATRGGKLEVFERVDFDTLFTEQKACK